MKQQLKRRQEQSNRAPDRVQKNNNVINAVDQEIEREEASRLKEEMESVLFSSCGNIFLVFEYIEVKSYCSYNMEYS